MRLPAITAALLAVAGCNQVFGIQETQGIDAEVPERPGPDAVGRVKLAVGRALTGMDGTPRTELTPVADASVRVGPRDGELVAASFVEGAYEYPQAALDTPMRARIQRSASPPLEIEWVQSGADVVVTLPVIGRVNEPGSADDLPHPAQWGLELVPAATAMMGRLLFVTGAWLEQGTNLPFTTFAPVDWAMLVDWFADTEVRPSAAAGDQAILVERSNFAGCSRTTGGHAEFRSLGFPDPDPRVENARLTWTANRQRLRVTWAPIEVTEGAEAALGELGPLQGGATKQDHLAFGYLPSPELPALLRLDARAARMTRPTMLSLLDCSTLTTQDGVTGPTYAAVDFLEAHLPAVVHVHVVYSRTTTNPAATLQSGFDILTLAPGDPTAIKTVRPAREAPFPTTIQLTRGGAVLDLGSGDDGSALSGSGVMTVSFQAETDVVEGTASPRRADFWWVTLIRVNAGSATHEVVASVLTSERTARFDPSGLPGGSYAFVIRASTGAPGASSGDFAMVAYPQSITTTTTKTFTL